MSFKRFYYANVTRSDRILASAVYRWNHPLVIIVLLLMSISHLRNICKGCARIDAYRYTISLFMVRIVGHLRSFIFNEMTWLLNDILQTSELQSILRQKRWQCLNLRLEFGFTSYKSVEWKVMTCHWTAHYRWNSDFISKIG